MMQETEAMVMVCSADAHTGYQRRLTPRVNRMHGAAHVYRASRPHRVKAYRLPKLHRAAKVTL